MYTYLPPTTNAGDASAAPSTSVYYYVLPQGNTAIPSALPNTTQFNPAQAVSQLQDAIADGNCERVQAILELGVDPNIQNLQGDRPLHIAALLGHDPIIRLLLRKKADPGLRNTCGKTAGQLADSNRYLATDNATYNLYQHIAGLLDLAENPLNLYDSLLTAIQRNNVETADHILSIWNGQFNINSEINTVVRRHKFPQGYTLLHVAARHSGPKILGLLIHKGANLNARVYNGVLPIQVAVESKDDRREVVEYLLNQHQVHVDTLQNDGGRTLLSRAVHYGRLEMVEFLLQRGANPHVIMLEGKDSNPVTVLQWAQNIYEQMLQRQKECNLHELNTYQQIVKLLKK